MQEFQASFPSNPAQRNQLLPHVAARPGMAGRKMCIQLLADVKDISSDLYLDACKKAVDSSDTERVELFTQQAENCVKELAPYLYGEIIAYAYSKNKKNISDALIEQCTSEQIACAPAWTLYLPAIQRDFRTMDALVAKGIDATKMAGEILHTLYSQHNGWMAEQLLKNGLKIENKNLSALHSCVKNGGLAGAQFLLDRGMDFERYLQWAQQRRLSTNGHDDTLAELEQYWKQLKISAQQDDSPQGLTLS